MKPIPTLRMLAATSAFAALFASTALADATVHILRSEVPNSEKAYHQQMAGDFEKSHPGVQIEFEYISNEAYKQKLTTLLQSEQKPDLIFSFSGGVLKQQAESGVLQDISASISDDVKARIPSTGFDAFTVDGKLYGLPVNVAEVVFWSNRDLAKKAGVDLDAIKTWDDFLAAVQKAKAAGITPIMVGGKDKWPLMFYYGYLWVREAGKAGMSAALAGEGEGFAAAPFVKAGEDFKKLIDLQPFEPGFMDTTFEQATGQFGDGKALFHLMGDWDYGTQKQNSVNGKGIPDDKLATIRFPAVPGGAGDPGDTFGGINGYAVVAGAQPEAVEFVKFMTEVENQKVAGAQGHYIPIAKGSEEGITNPYFRMMSEDVSKSQFHQLFLDQALGSDVGATALDISADLAQGVTTPQDAAKAMQDAWSMR